MSRTLFVTAFDKKTRVCTASSQPLHTSDLDAAKAMFGGKPDAVTKNTMIFNQPEGQALCVSWIRFSL